MLKMNAFYLPVYALSLSLAVMNAGCLATDTTADEEDEELGTAQSALCSDTSLIPNATGSLTSPSGYDVGTSASATSPSSTYGSLACAGRFVMDISNTAGQPNLGAYASWENNGLSQASCSQGHANAAFYGWNGASWVQIGGTVDQAGVWTPTFGGYFCSVGAGISLPNNTYAKIRVAGKAYRVNGSTTPQVVTVGASAFH
jgi:hypothetical protein